MTKHVRKHKFNFYIIRHSKLIINSLIIISFQKYDIVYVEPCYNISSTCLYVISREKCNYCLVRVPTWSHITRWIFHFKLVCECFKHDMLIISMKSHLSRVCYIIYAQNSFKYLWKCTWVSISDPFKQLLLLLQTNALVKYSCEAKMKNRCRMYPWLLSYRKIEK